MTLSTGIIQSYFFLSILGFKFMFLMIFFIFFVLLTRNFFCFMINFFCFFCFNSCKDIPLRARINDLVFVLTVLVECISQFYISFINLIYHLSVKLLIASINCDISTSTNGLAAGLKQTSIAVIQF